MSWVYRMAGGWVGGDIGLDSWFGSCIWFAAGMKWGICWLLFWLVRVSWVVRIAVGLEGVMVAVVCVCGCWWSVGWE